MLSLVLGSVITIPASARYWVDGGAEKLHAWLAQVPIEDDFELAMTITTGLRLLGQADSDTAVDSALTLLATEVDAFASFVPEDRITKLYALLGQTYVYRFEKYEAARPLLLEAVERLEHVERQPAELYFTSSTALAHTFFWNFKSAELLQVARTAYNYSLKLRDAYWQAHFAKLLGRALSQDGRGQDAEFYYEEVLALAQATGTSAEQFDAYLSLATLNAQEGNPERGLTYIVPALKLANGGSSELGYGLLWQGSMLSAMGRVDEALDVLHEAHTILDAHGNRDNQVHIRMELARAYRRSGEYERALALVDSAMQATKGIVTPYNSLFQHEELTETYAGLGNYEKAFYHLKEYQKITHHLDSISSDQELAAIDDLNRRTRSKALVQAQADWLADRRWFRKAMWGLGGLVVLGAAGGFFVGRRMG